MVRGLDVADDDGLASTHRARRRARICSLRRRTSQMLKSHAGSGYPQLESKLFVWQGFIIHKELLTVELEGNKAEAGERGQGNWVLQMQPRWEEEEADAEATSGGGGDRDRNRTRRRPLPSMALRSALLRRGRGSRRRVRRHRGVLLCVLLAPAEEGAARGGQDNEYSKMSYLCNIAYIIPRIQQKCLRRYNLRFVASSVQEKAMTGPDEKQENSTGKTEYLDQESEAAENVAPASEEKGSGLGINPFGAYRVVLYAASYLHSRAVGILPVWLKE